MMKGIALVVVLLAGCATTAAEYEGTKKSWLGAHYDEVVLNWGAPVRSTPLSDGRLAYTWISDRPGTGGAIYPSLGIFGGSRGGGAGVGVGVGMGVGSGGGYSGDFERCERTLVFKEARAVDQIWYGPAGYCSTFRPR